MGRSAGRGGSSSLLIQAQACERINSVASLSPSYRLGFSAPRPRGSGRLLFSLAPFMLSLAILPVATASVSSATLENTCSAYGDLSRRLSSFLVPPRVTCPRSLDTLNSREAQTRGHPEVTDFRFLVYDVKNGEGFHLQKEVIYRVALVVSMLNARSAQQARMTQLHAEERARQVQNHARVPLSCASPPPSSSSRHECAASSTSLLFPVWVLVLPPWCRLAHWRFSEEAVRELDGNPWLRHVPWGAFFDFEHLRERIPVMEYEDFLTYQLTRPDPWGDRRQRKETQTAPIRSAVVPDGRQSDRAQRGEGSRGKVEQTTGASEEGYSPSGDVEAWRGVSLWFGGFCGTVRTLEMWCAKLYMPDAERVADLLWHSVAERPSGAVQTLGLKFGENLLVPWPNVLLDTHLLDMLYVHPKLREIGDLFIRSLLSSREVEDANEGYRDIARFGGERGEVTAKGGYISAHLRRTDFLYLNRSVSLQRAAEYLVGRMQEHGVFKAFICTDGTEDEKRVLRDAVAQVGAAASFATPSVYTVVFFEVSTVRSLVRANPRTSSHVAHSGSFHVSKGEPRGRSGDYTSLLLHPGITALIEVWIAARAAYFIGTKDSRFSQAIRWERHLMGHPHDSSLEVFCVDRSSDQTGDRGRAKCFATKSHDPPEGRSRSELRRKYWPS
ncbi:conserved hypothetical protein [Neospora caninum Liverpool]|uniref:GDP-fucose protein O-fucosyltransferase 2 n=1 Tax=Neospora caninum (strain Liverpool) TaxID=572307 RepID=F0VIR2_NEOCL|nr:conserved hypothetical protein [Neospora caninum Liverpool]CBZ53623.1 conserved hypothetical protein [Neospora caninum Liverpool]|eukprot:XP_003883655.1 conserved hypothetical protein [Neospora caninum Liverpool]